MGKIENEGMPVVRLDRQLKYQGNILIRDGRKISGCAGEAPGKKSEV